ncbi:MAG: hypothetical protein MJ125_04165 [Clostridia bacterium]|nr:hypothetical protein [Clostridia bacterium]
MKKIIAIVLAVLMAFSCSALCFAEDAVIAPAPEASESTTAAPSILAGFTGILNQISSLLDANGLLAKVQNLINQIKAFIEQIVSGGNADVAGAIDDLEAKIAELPIVGDVLEYLHNLINTLKQKVKDFYAHAAETAPVTAEATPVETGSTSVGLVAFAAVSVAAVAAFVCTKKKEN